MKATRLGPSEAEVIAALEAFEQHALSQGFILEGRKNSFGRGYHVAARRADTGERLHMSFAMTPGMATHWPEYLAALTNLLAGVVAATVPK